MTPSRFSFLGGPLNGDGRRKDSDSTFQEVPHYKHRKHKSSAEDRTPRTSLLGSTIKAHHPQGWVAKPWVLPGSPGCRMVLVHPESAAVPSGRRYQVLVSCAVSAASLRGLRASPSRPTSVVGNCQGSSPSPCYNPCQGSGDRSVCVPPEGQRLVLRAGLSRKEQRNVCKTDAALCGFSPW